MVHLHPHVLDKSIANEIISGGTHFGFNHGYSTYLMFYDFIRVVCFQVDSKYIAYFTFTCELSGKCKVDLLCQGYNIIRNNDIVLHIDRAL